MNSVVIYRHQLFKPSEPFIAQQATALRAFRPIFVGRSLLGAPPHPNARVLVLSSRAGPTGRIRMAANVLFRSPSGFLELLSGERPALIHAHFGVEGLYALGLARRMGIPLVTTFHGFDATVGRLGLLRSGKVSWIQYACHRSQLARGGDLFVCVSDFIRRRLISQGFPEERTVTHYIGIDTEAIRPRIADDQRRVILHVGRLVEKKGTAVLLRAFARVARAEPDIELVVVGDGPLRPVLESLAAELQLGTRARFLGSCDHATTLDWMARCQIFCLPSVTARSGDAEGLGMVFLEAAACARPVVGTRHGGIPEVVEDGVSGFLVAERSDGELAERLLHLVRNDTERVRMGTAGRRMVEARFDLHRQTSLLEDFYRRLL